LAFTADGAGGGVGVAPGVLSGGTVRGRWATPAAGRIANAANAKVEANIFFSMRTSLKVNSWLLFYRRRNNIFGLPLNSF
jgi:hypothetical protein